MNPTDMHNAAKLADQLEGAFVWSETPEGHEFWSDIYAKLCAIAGVDDGEDEPEDEDDF